MTILDHVEKYLEWKATYTMRAAAVYRPYLAHFASVMGDKALSAVTLDDILKYRKILDGKYQPYTIQLAMVAVHNFFSFWTMQRYQCVAPALIRVPRTVPRPRPVVSEEDYALILDHFKSSNTFYSVRNELIIRLLWDTGMRISELCDLNLSDIEDGKCEALVRTRKSERMRQVFWTPETNAVLHAYMARKRILSSSPALFIGLGPGGASDRLKPRMIQNIVSDLSKTLKLGKAITPHSFRHGKAHKILRMGGNAKHVGSILGHSETNPMAAYHYLQYDNVEHKDVCLRFLGNEVPN